MKLSIHLFGAYLMGADEERSYSDYRWENGQFINQDQHAHR